MEIFSFLDKLLMKIIRPPLILIGLTVATMLAVGIFSRSVLNAPIFGLEEIMLIGIMWFYMLGAALASRERAHLSADFIKVISSNPKVWRIAGIFSAVVSLIVACFFVTWAYDLFAWGVKKGQSTPVFGIPWAVSQASLFFASILFVAYLVRDLISEIKGDKHLVDDTTQAEE